MTDADNSTSGIATPLSWVSIVFLLSAAFVRLAGPDPLRFFGVYIANALVCHSLILIGLSLNVSSMLLRPEKQRYAWLPVPILLIYAVLIGKDWVGLLG